MELIIILLDRLLIEEIVFVFHFPKKKSESWRREIEYSDEYLM
jgi:hypothetical protein